MKRLAVAALCVLVAVIILTVTILLKPSSAPCQRLQARLDLADRFCAGLSERAAQEKCAEYSSNPEVMGQCMRVVLPAAHSSCMDYLSVQNMRIEFKNICDP